MREQGPDLPSLEITVKHAFAFYAESEALNIWAQRFMLKASTFFINKVNPITRREFLKEGIQKEISPFDQLFLQTRVWRTRQIPIHSGNHIIPISLLGYVRGNNFVRPNEVIIRATDPLGPERIIYKINRDEAINWSEKPMSQRERYEADNILQIFDHSLPIISQDGN